MKFIHTFSTSPMMNNDTDIIPFYYRLTGLIICSALSVACVKKFGHSITLHTDDLGKEMLDFIPYDDIHLTLNDLPDIIHPKFFAAGKMWSMEKEPLDTYHIDNDVFLQKQDVFDLIENTDYDLLIQEIEKTRIYHDWTANVYHDNPDFFNNLGLNVDCDHAYNTGIVNFRNQELKDKFIDNYKKIVLHYSENYPEQINKIKSIPDLFAEQVNLYQLANGKYNVFHILDRKNNKGYGKEIGYYHILTNIKYTQLSYLLDILKDVDFDLYEKTVDMCDEIKKLSPFDSIDLKIEGVTPQNILDRFEKIQLG